MRVNTRIFTVQQAENEIHKAVLDKVQEHGLTRIETLQILNSISASTLKYALRAERHGDESLEADLDHDDLDEAEEDQTEVLARPIVRLPEDKD